jgi:type IV pilus assembly protein PilA
MKRQQNKGFTLAELLIVVAIIAVLVAISIPIFSNQLRKARFATNLANARAAKAAVIAGYFDTNGTRIHDLSAK